jgi:hypothetical protein
MKEFILKKILLLSLKEEKARKIIFHRKRTVIMGLNSTGESCLLKSIYQTFGAEPQNLHPNWKEANVICLVSFSVGAIDYSILRYNKTYSLFGSDGGIINSFNKISELSIKLAEVFDFKIKLKDKKGVLITPPPAYIFLPYYADQDKSWTNNWLSFSKLYLPNTKTDIVNYHTGIKPNEYYLAKGELSIVNTSINDIDKEITILRNLLKNLKNKLSKVDFNLNINDFQNEIKELLINCEELNKIQNRVKQDLSVLYNQKINIEAQLIITKKALTETNKDYSFASNELETIVPCPSCGAEYENSFSERFEIAQDEQRCLDLIIELQEEFKLLTSRIKFTNNEFSNNNTAISEIEKLLETKKEKIKLKDIIENEGKREMKKVFDSEIIEFESELKERLLLQKQFEDELKTYDDRKRSLKIRSEYKDYMAKYLKKLNVHSLSENSYKRIDSTIKESGSTTPRALIAYYYSILQVIKNNGSSTFCPIVIDSPNQQGQDRENLPKLLQFIIDEQPKDSQLILAIEESHGIDFEAKIIQLNKKRSLLLKDEFVSVFNEIKPYLKQQIEDNTGHNTV